MHSAKEHSTDAKGASPVFQGASLPDPDLDVVDEKKPRLVRPAAVPRLSAAGVASAAAETTDSDKKHRNNKEQEDIARDLIGDLMGGLENDLASDMTNIGDRPKAGDAADENEAASNLADLDAREMTTLFQDMLTRQTMFSDEIGEVAKAARANSAGIANIMAMLAKIDSKLERILSGAQSQKSAGAAPPPATG